MNDNHHEHHGSSNDHEHNHEHLQTDHDGHQEGHGHSHGLVDRSILRSREGLKAVGYSLIALFITSAIQIYINQSTHSVALLSDLIHNFGDALTAIPLGIAFFLQSKYGEKLAGYAVVLVIFVSACAALVQTIQRFIHPQTPHHLWALAIGGVIGFLGNEIAGIIRTGAGKKLNSPALIADGKHARIDGLVSLGVVIATVLVSFGFPIADPIVSLAITIIILRITWQSWITIKASN